MPKIHFKTLSVLCLLVLPALIGCEPEIAIPITEPEDIQSYTITATDAITTAPESQTAVESAEAASVDDNPYVRYWEANDSWRYAIYEIFRGAKVIDMIGRLEYMQDYEHIIKEEGYPDMLHSYTCQLSLPQATGEELWTQGLNAYYQGLLPELIAEGDHVWETNIDDWYISGLSYYFEGAYQQGEVICVVRSCFFDGWRPSVGWNPFADVFSALDGKKLELDDLFSVPRETWLPAVEDALAHACNRFYEGYQPEHGDWYRELYSDDAIEYMEKASVAVTPVGLVFIYPVGYAGDMAAGTVFLDIPFEQLQEFLNPAYFPYNND